MVLCIFQFTSRIYPAVQEPGIRAGEEDNKDDEDNNDDEIPGNISYMTL